MAYVGIQLFLIVLSGVLTNASSPQFTAFSTIECKPEVVAQYGRQTTLECTVKAKWSDIEIQFVSWKKDGRVLLSFHKGSITSTSGFQFAEPTWNSSNRNVSLLITNTGVAHRGIYECKVITNRGEDTKLITLSVTAQYSKPIIRSLPKMIDPNAETTLICSSSGGYPIGQLRWFDVDNFEWTKSATMDVTQSDGLYNLTSRLQLGSIQSKYTCVVFNASGSKEDEAAFDVPANSSGQMANKDSKSQYTVTAPLVVIGSLIVGLGLLILIVMHYRRHKRADTTNPANGYTTAVEDDQHEDGLDPDNHV